MKVAVCLSGHMRTFEKTYDSLKRHLLERYDCNVFIHTWKKNGSERTDIDLGGGNDIDVNAVINAYKPSNIIVDGPIEFDPGRNSAFVGARSPPKNVLSKLYSARVSFELCKKWAQEHSHTFDVVLSLRPDLLWNNDIDLVMPEHNVLYIPGNIKVPEKTYLDYIAYGSFDVMSKYFDLFLNWDNTCKELDKKFRPESVLTLYIQSLSIPVKHFNVYYSVPRMNGQVLEMGYLNEKI
jgi:hypothetical protein